MRNLLFLSLVLTFSCGGPNTPTYDVLIKNAQVLQLDSGTYRTLSLGITNGRIENVIPPSELSLVSTKEIIDAKGKYALPGLWDNHVHFRGGENLVQANANLLPFYLDYGITTVRDAGGDLTSHVRLWQKEIEEATRMGPTIFTSGPKIDGKSPTWAGSFEVANPQDIVKSLDSLQKLKVDFVKLYDSTIDGALYLETIREAEKRGMKVTGHLPYSIPVNEAIDAGLDGIEHLYFVLKACSSKETEITAAIQDGSMGFWEALPLLLESYEETTAQAFFNKLKDKGVFVVPTLHIGHTLSYLDEIDHSQDAFLSKLPQDFIDTYQGRISRFERSSTETREKRKALDTFFQQLTYKLYTAGVPLLAGSDNGAYNAYVYPGISLHLELAAMVKTGIPPLDALKSSFVNGPDLLDKDAFGSLEQGKIADILLLNSDPLQQIESLQDIYLTLKSGVPYNPQAKN
ncbi:amidohydrolase family protein [Sediminicola luteus]|uniref:Amidohydrolase n=1 Tax=Sediminicola luteus TaxID=319238 RepID=A0A2A4GA61_9FLAO|nr:amidohydrolase family protein [Sediminicola luteus]PCE64645.1 amidohydrolase [Sediminicola luteus]